MSAGTGSRPVVDRWQVGDIIICHGSDVALAVKQAWATDSAGGALTADPAMSVLYRLVGAERS
jgi:hypothetical protein